MTSLKNADVEDAKLQKKRHSMGQTTSQLGTSHRRCWECVRRRRVCDLTQPECTKCKQAGLVCSGYGEFKPVTWLPVGKVKSKVPVRRKPNNLLERKIQSSTAGRSYSPNSGSDEAFTDVSRFTPRDLISDVVNAGDYCKCIATVGIRLSSLMGYMSD
jgi:hypothetical protein